MTHPSPWRDPSASHLDKVTARGLKSTFRLPSEDWEVTETPGSHHIGLWFIGYGTDGWRRFANMYHEETGMQAIRADRVHEANGDLNKKRLHQDEVWFYVEIDPTAPGFNLDRIQAFIDRVQQYVAGQKRPSLGVPRGFDNSTTPQQVLAAVRGPIGSRLSSTTASRRS